MPENKHLNSALESVLAQRLRQNAKWGEQNHDPAIWSLILTEETGEFARAVLQMKSNAPGPRGNLREEAVQCAAVALQIVEWLDRIDEMLERIYSQ